MLIRPVELRIVKMRGSVYLLLSADATSCLDLSTFAAVSVIVYRQQVEEETASVHKWVLLPSSWKVTFFSWENYCCYYCCTLFLSQFYILNIMFYVR